MFKDNADLYPTPENLIRKMVNKVKWNSVKNILEPSAGLGHIVEYINKDMNKYSKYNISTIELDNNCRNVLLQKNINVLRVYANVQFTNMKGEFHQDDGETTFLLMVSKTLEKNSGQFQIKINNTIESIDFQQNKLIYFQSKLFHRGLDPKEHGIPRITLVFKTGNILE
jgi:phospholipid N-methyltransferase